ncbi:EAL domain-containing protein [Synechocystis sp. LKSZ1]|uniref:EAL domain-containing protein n=1 Tax=Synechocystis sp. LKSZ1 TaxID=3144951 RepID=UPI00336BEE57
MSTNLEKQHILVLEDSAFRRTIVLDGPQYSLGRHSNSDIQMFSRQASRHHATLLRKFNSKLNADVFWIIDGDLDGNKSQNGVFVNGEKCLVRELKDGDLINFGCDVNASYHNSSGDRPASLKDLERDNSRRTNGTEGGTPNKSTLILSQYSISNVRPDDETFQDMSYLDVVTNLPNHLLFLEYLNIALSNAERYQHEVGLVLFQLTNWEKLINTVGSNLGDLILNQTGQKLKSCLRNGDIVARWGIEEFMVLLPQIRDRDNLERISARLFQVLVTPFVLQGHSIHLQVTYGLALYPQSGNGTDLLIKAAYGNLHTPSLAMVSPAAQLEAELLAANISSDDLPTSIKTPSLPNLPLISPEERERLAKVEKRIERALKNEELDLYYQPQVNLQSGQVEAMEALIRWKHPQQGVLAPQQFLPWSDQTEMIVPLTHWILETACRQCQAWHQQGFTALVVSVNLSDKQFYHPQLLPLVQEVLTQTGLMPTFLELEMTEATILRNFEFAENLILALHDGGIRISLDNFGKGFASLRYLQEFPLNKFKIDKSFVINLVEHPENTAMLEALINLGQSFKVQVVAEGVEVQEQVNILADLNCFAMQGYHFSKPLNAEDASQFLVNH